MISIVILIPDLCVEHFNIKLKSLICKVFKELTFLRALLHMSKIKIAFFNCYVLGIVLSIMTLIII